MSKSYKDFTIGVIGLGYVGLPLAVALGRRFRTFGYDINETRIDELNLGKDRTREISGNDLKSSKLLSFISSNQELEQSNCNIFIVTVPTPIDIQKLPDLRPIESATEMLGFILKKGDTVIYESTVYPGLTEEICVPILEKNSGLKFNSDFNCGYSPERINPGDKNHRLQNITKVISASNNDALDSIEFIYSSIIKAGVHKASSIKVAEMAKVIENTQRDINIALVNEISVICDKLHIDVHEVLEAASTKWNFLNFKPGLVGGHCIGVDPYYLLYKSGQLGYEAKIISSGRKINDEMPNYIARKALDILQNDQGNKILILGYTFKENCPDIRNTKVKDLVESFQALNNVVSVYDPWVLKEDLNHDEKSFFIDEPINDLYDLVFLAVPHSDFLIFKGDRITELLKPNGKFFDYKNFLK